MKEAAPSLGVGFFYPALKWTSEENQTNRHLIFQAVKVPNLRLQAK
jgi:hypothetical protein